MQFAEKRYRLEPFVPLALGVHGLVMLLYFGGEPWLWAVVGAVALFGGLRLIWGHGSSRTTLFQAGSILVLAWLLMFTTGGTGSFFLLWYFVLIPVYTLLLEPGYAIVLTGVASVAYLILLPFSLQQPPTVVVARAFLLAFIGWLVQALGSALTRSVIEHEQTEEALRQSEKRFRELLESAPDAIVVVNSEGRIVLTNTQVGKMFGYTSDELRGQPVETLLPERFRERHVIHRANYYSAPRNRPMGVDLNLAGRHKDGSEFPAEISLSPLETADGILVTSIIRDITERKRLEEQYYQAQKMEAIGQLTGGIAHDFNNILTAVNGFAELLQRRLPPDSPLQKMAGQILDSGQRAANLIRQLLAFSRKQTIEPKILDLNTVVVEMEKMLQRIIGEDIDLKTILAPDLWSIKTDPA